MYHSFAIVTLTQIATLIFAAVSVAAECSVSLKLTVEAGKHDRENTPVRALVLIPSGWVNQAAVILRGPDGTPIAAQLARAALLDKLPPTSGKNAPRFLWWVLPKLRTGRSIEYHATISPGDAGTKSRFAWHDEEGKYRDLYLGNRPVLRYMYQAYEDDPEKRDLNNKPFHHLFDSTGKLFLTKGSGGSETHHQGLFYGFGHCTFEGGECDIWWCHHGEHQLHQRFLSETAGLVLARHRTSIDWNDQQGKPFCSEVRELTAYDVPGGTLVEWSSRLKSVRGKVTLDGNAQHAGFQFRAHDEVAKKTKGKTYFLRPDGRAQTGQTRNPTRGQEVCGTKDAATMLVMDLPWKVMSFVVGGKRYSAEYIDNPKNPKPSFYSERDYGRFGSWFGKQELLEDGPPIELTYRIWLQNGEMTLEQATALWADFAEPPGVLVEVAN
jgi:hypothetical protein